MNLFTVASFPCYQSPFLILPISSCDFPATNDNILLLWVYQAFVSEEGTLTDVTYWESILSSQSSACDTAIRYTFCSFICWFLAPRLVGWVLFVDFPTHQQCQGILNLCTTCIFTFELWTSAEYYQNACFWNILPLQNLCPNSCWGVILSYKPFRMKKLPHQHDSHLTRTMYQLYEKKRYLQRQ